MLWYPHHAEMYDGTVRNTQVRLGAAETALPSYGFAKAVSVPRQCGRAERAADLTISALPLPIAVFHDPASGHGIAPSLEHYP